MRIYGATGRGTIEYDHKTLDTFLGTSGLQLYKGTIINLNLRKKSEYGGGVLEGRVNVPQKGIVPLLMFAVDANDAPKHYTQFLDEMNCRKVGSFYYLSTLEDEQVGVIWDGISSNPAGFLSSKSLRLLTANDYDFKP